MLPDKMMSLFSFNRENLLSGFQWFFFIFCNTIVVPPTLQSAFQLPDSTLFTLMQYAFFSTGLACLAQAFFGHQRAIMEGPTGLWWGTILTVTLAEAARGTPITSVASSLALGVALSAILTIVIGVSGLGRSLARLFSPAVMVVFMLLLGAQLTTIFFKGMLGLPFGVTGGTTIHIMPFILAAIIMFLMLAMIILLPSKISRYALLTGTLTGWIIYRLCFPASAQSAQDIHWKLFPLGSHGQLSTGIVLTMLLTGIVNISNTYGAIQGTNEFYPEAPASKAIWRRSFIVSGVMTLITVPLNVVPFSPFVSSTGLITQTGDSRRLPFVMGGLCCLLVGIISPLTHLFCTLPLPISSAVMLVSYLPLLLSSLSFSQQLSFTTRNIYRLALPIFVGLFLMGLSPVYLQNLPLLIRPLLSNGLLVGILLAVLMDNLIPWRRIK